MHTLFDEIDVVGTAHQTAALINILERGLTGHPDDSDPAETLAFVAVLREHARVLVAAAEHAAQHVDALKAEVAALRAQLAAAQAVPATA